jgi:hypothetical protein
MSALSKAGELAVTMVLAVLQQLPAAQRPRVLDAARERLRFDAAGDRKLAARKRKVIK